MLMSRRSMLALMASVAAGGAIARLPSAGAMAAPVPMPALPLSSRNYQGLLLTNWHVAVGDGLYACDPALPVTLDDIETALHGASSVLQANIEKRCVMAHNITFLRIRDDDAFKFTHRCGYKFRIPYEIVDDVETDYAAETVEGGLFIWDGDKTLDAEAYDYGVAFQVVINPWSPNYGKVFVWQGNDEWGESGVQMIRGAAWHEVQIGINFQKATAMLRLDNLDISTSLSRTSKEWGAGTDARLQVETVSKKPIPEGVRAMSEVDVTHWHWTWDRNGTAYLPMTHGPVGATKILQPTQEQAVFSPVTVHWFPGDQPMDVQVYQNEMLIDHYADSLSGIVIDIDERVRTEIKIWEIDAAEPADSVWVNVVAAQFIAPEAEQTVVGPVTVRWLPDDQPMDVQVYQNGQQTPVQEYPNSRAGIVIDIDEPGRTVIKISEPGTAEPDDSVSINLVKGQILIPDVNQAVVSPFTVRWQPDDTLMTVQVYQNDQLADEYPASPCGVKIEVEDPGLTEIKIWKLGDSEQHDSIWVNVSDDPQSLLWEVSSPVQNQTVESPIAVCWRPECSAMDIRLYRDDALIVEKSGVQSGEEFEISGEGEIEVKIWVPGAAEPADSLWVHLIDDSSHKLPI